MISQGRIIIGGAGAEPRYLMDIYDGAVEKVVTLLVSVGIIAFGAWIAAATIAKGWPLVWTLMALFPLLTGFISLHDSIKGTEA